MVAVCVFRNVSSVAKSGNGPLLLFRRHKNTFFLERAHILNRTLWSGGGCGGEGGGSHHHHHCLKRSAAMVAN
jgi:hypothetical protein